VVCYEVTDRNGIDKANEGIDENLRMIKKIAIHPGSGRVKATFGMHAGLTLSEETLQRCRDRLPENYGIHIHVAEHPVDEYDSLSKTGERVIDRLSRHGFLGENSIIVHGVHLDQKEVNLILQTKTWLSHQPRSNMNNAVGLSDIDSLLRLGLKVCMGNDGFSNAMWDEWRTCYLAHKNWNQDPQRMNGNNVIEMAIHNNSDLASHFFGGNKIGKIEVGAKADLILVDYLPFTELSVENLPWHIIFGFRDSMVTTTIVDGRVLMKDRKLLFLDESTISKEATKFSTEVWKRFARKF
jgi:cytosine/adenosine deaminase-related metal-dependent hydrolase